MKHFLILGLFCLSSTLFAQNTLTLGNKKPPKANLQEMAWLTGYWQGEAFGGISEEIWAPPAGDSMMGSYRSVKDGKVEFYEICQIRQEGETLMMRIKHFHGDLKGWEEKDETVEFPLVKIDKEAAYFEGWTIKKLSENEIVMYVNVGSEDQKQEIEFKYKRKSL